MPSSRTLVASFPTSLFPKYVLCVHYVTVSKSVHALSPPHPLTTKDGFIDISEAPGFGVTLYRKNLHRPYDRPGLFDCVSSDAAAEESAANAKKNIERPLPEHAHMPF